MVFYIPILKLIYKYLKLFITEKIPNILWTYISQNHFNLQQIRQSKTRETVSKIICRWIWQKQTTQDKNFVTCIQWDKCSLFNKVMWKSTKFVRSPCFIPMLLYEANFSPIFSTMCLLGGDGLLDDFLYTVCVHVGGITNHFSQFQEGDRPYFVAFEPLHQTHG